MRIIQIIFVVVVISMAGCLNDGLEDSIGVDQPHLISLNLNKDVLKISYSEVYKDMEIIPLETSDNSLIGAPVDWIINNDRIIILDAGTRTSPSKKILVFDSEGGHIGTKISGVDRGPGSFNSVDCLIESGEGEFCVYDNAALNLITFNDSLQVKEEVILGVFLQDLFLKGDTQIIYRGHLLFDNGRFPDLGTAPLADQKLIMKVGEDLSSLGNFELNARLSGLSFFHQRLFQPFEGELYFADIFSNSIYRYAMKRGFSKFIELDIGSHIATPNDLNGYKPGSQLWYEQIKNLAGNKITRFDFIHRISNFLLTSLTLQMMTYHLAFDISSGKYIVFTIEQENTLMSKWTSFRPCFALYDDYYFSINDSRDYAEFRERGEDDSYVLRKLEGLTVNSNPLVIKARVDLDQIESLFRIKYGE